MAFEDTWEWNIDAEAAYLEIVERGGRVSDAMRAFRTFLGNSDMMAYLAMMAPRLIELHRVLKVTGSIYLHCDPTASHYLKIILDAIFGPEDFLNEVTWKGLGDGINRRRMTYPFSQTNSTLSPADRPSLRRTSSGRVRRPRLPRMLE
jgi:hypothetical protein